MKVLVVEDEPIARAVAETVLRSLGHDVVSASDGEAAWTALEDRSIRVVLSDWQLPKLDGLALCRRVREQRDDYVCFILVTQAPATGANLDAAVEAGVDEFLTKPIDPHEVKRRLHVAARMLSFTSELRRLESFLSICGYCKNVRDAGDWRAIESYVSERAGTRFSHGVCPHCYERKVVPQLEKLGIPTPRTLPQTHPVSCQRHAFPGTTRTLTIP